MPIIQAKKNWSPFYLGDQSFENLLMPYDSFFSISHYRSLHDIDWSSCVKPKLLHILGNHNPCRLIAAHFGWISIWRYFGTLTEIKFNI